MVVILSPDAIPSVQMTVDEYLQANLPEGYRYELVDGVVQMSPNPDNVHEAVVSSLAEILFRYKGQHPQSMALIAFNGSVPIPDSQRVREPDIAVYARWSTQGRRYTVWKEFIPSLVVEVVSPGQERRDYEEKRDDYGKTGVAEYWIVDPDQGRITVLSRVTESWQENVFGRGEIVTTQVLPGLAFNVDEVLPSLT